MRKYEINGVTVEVIREESVSNNYTIFSRLTSLLNSLKNEDEFLNIMEVSLEELVEEIMQGKIADGKTQAAIMKVAWMMK